MERERKQKRAKEREKMRGDWGVLSPSLPSFFPALSLALFFARAPLSERLEQASGLYNLHPTSLDRAAKHVIHVEFNSVGRCWM